MNLGAKGVTEFFFLSVPCCLVLVLNQRIEIVTSRCTNYNSVIYISRYRANCQSCHRDVTIWLSLENNHFNTFTKVDQTQRFTKYFLSICKICNLIVVHIHHLARAFLCGVFMFFSCLRGFSPATPALSTIQKHAISWVRLIGDSKLAMRVIGCLCRCVDPATDW